MSEPHLTLSFIRFIRQRKTSNTVEIAQAYEAVNVCARKKTANRNLHSTLTAYALLSSVIIIYLILVG